MKHPIGDGGRRPCTWQRHPRSTIAWKWKEGSVAASLRCHGPVETAVERQRSFPTEGKVLDSNLAMYKDETMTLFGESNSWGGEKHSTFLFGKSFCICLGRET